MTDDRKRLLSSDRPERGALQAAHEALADYPAIVAMHEEQAERAEAEVARLRAALETLPDRVRALGGFQKFREGEVWVSRDDVLRMLDEALNGGERMAEQVDLPVIAHDDDGMEHCPTCGSLVCVVQDDDREGTSHYEPVGSQGVERLAEQLRGAVEAIDDAVHVILDALSALHPEPAKRLMETASYKAFVAYVKRGQSETRGATDESLAPSKEGTDG